MPSFVSLLHPNKYSFLLSEKAIFKANMKDISVTNVKYYVDLIHEQVRLDLPFEQRIENDLTEINVHFLLIQVSFSSLNELVHHSRKHLLNIGILEFNFDGFWNFKKDSSKNRFVAAVNEESSNQFKLNLSNA